MPQSTSNRTKRATTVVLSLGLASVLLVTACSGDDAASPSSTTVAADANLNPDGLNPSVFSAVTVPPGQIDAAIAALPGIVETTMQETGIPGFAVAVVHDGKVAFTEGFGLANVDTGAEVDADTAFQLASVSKSIGATVISEQVGKGTIAWDDPIVEHLPGFQLSDPYVTEHVTYADMYSHRSGLPDHIGDTLEDLGYDRTQVLDRLRYVPLTPFRAENHYTNFGITAAAQAVANAAGTTWDELSATTLYEPLGMTNTTSSYAEFQTQPNRAALHVPTDNGWEQLNTRDADAQSPAGGVSSSVNDLTAWMQLLLDDGMHDGTQLVDPDVLHEMLSPHSSVGPSASMTARAGSDDLGFNASINSTARQTFSHSGAFAMGAGTSFTIVPAENLGIVVLTNGFPMGAAEAVGAQFLDLALVGGLTQDWLPAYRAQFDKLMANPASITDPAPANPAPALADSAYTGVYANDYYGPAEITQGTSGLVLKLGPSGATYPLTHWDGNEFTWIAPGENSPGPSLVTFAVGPEGTASALTIDALNQVPPLGTFTR